MTKWKDLPEEEFDIILADPPWSYYGQQDKWGAAAKFYETASDEEIKQLPIPKLLSKNGIIFLWTTSPKMDVSIDCLREWGLHYRGIAFVWVKTKKDGKTPIGAQGIRPSIVKPTAEYVIVGSRVEKGRPLPLHDEGIPNVILSPKREHSRKPDVVHLYIERMYPSAKKIELFARERKKGWHVWGNEVDKFSPRDIVSSSDEEDSCFAIKV